jgi:hypothetical protein
VRSELTDVATHSLRVVLTFSTVTPVVTTTRRVDVVNARTSILANVTSNRILRKARNENNSDKELSSSTLWKSFLSLLAFEFVVNPPLCEEQTSSSLV